MSKQTDSVREESVARTAECCVLSGSASGDHDRGAGRLVEASIGVLLHGIEIHGVTSRKLERLHADPHFQSSLDQVKQLHSLVMVRYDLVRRQRMKVRQVAAQLSLIHPKVEALKMPRYGCRFRIGWKYLAFVATHNSYDMPLSGVAEKVVQTDVEYQGYSRERWERGHKSAILEPR